MLSIIPFIKKIKKTRLIKIILVFFLLKYPSIDKTKRPNESTVMLALINKSNIDMLYRPHQNYFFSKIRILYWYFNN